MTAKSRQAAGMPLSSLAAVAECRARTCDEVDDGSGYEYLAGLCGFADATCEVDGDARELGAASYSRLVHAVLYLPHPADSYDSWRKRWGGVVDLVDEINRMVSLAS